MPHQDLSIRRLIKNAINAAFSEEPEFIDQSNIGRYACITTPPDRDYYLPALKDNWDTFFNYKPYTDYVIDNMPASVLPGEDGGWSGWMVSEFSSRKIPIIIVYYQDSLAVTFVPPDRYEELRNFAKEKSAYLLIKHLHAVPKSFSNN